MGEHNKYLILGASHELNKDACFKILGNIYIDLDLPLVEKIKSKQSLRYFFKSNNNDVKKFNDDLLKKYSYNKKYTYLDIFRYCLNKTLKSNQTN